MIGRIARLALLLEATVHAGLALMLAARGWGPAGIAFLALSLAGSLRIMIALVPFATVLLLRIRDGRAVAGQGFAAAIAGECLAKSLSFTWWQPFERWSMRPEPAGGPAAARPVLLIHGYFCNRGSWRVMQRALCARLPHPVHALSLEPPLGAIDDYVEQVEQRIESILAGSGHDRVHLVCHSMGGLVARAWLARHSGWNRVASLTMLGSPHHGTELARLGIGRNARQMRRGSEWLVSLAAREQGLQPAVPVTSIHTENDNLVYPPESSDLPWARNLRLAGVGHVQLQSAAECTRLVAEAIESADAPGGP